MTPKTPENRPKKSPKTGQKQGFWGPRTGQGAAVRVLAPKGPGGAPETTQKQAETGRKRTQKGPF